MKTWSCIICVLLVLCLNNALDEKSAFHTWTVQRIQGLENTIQKTGCQQYLASGYKYENIYPIDGLEFDNVVVKKSQGNLIYFEMHLAIKAPQDGILLLSPTRDPGANDLVFEIGVGINSNQFTILRLLKDSKDGEVLRIKSDKVLSTSRYASFYLIISDDTLTFGKEGGSPIITYSDPQLRNVKYFGMSSWGSAQGKFLYDCPQASQIYCYYKSD